MGQSSEETISAVGASSTVGAGGNSVAGTGAGSMAAVGTAVSVGGVSGTAVGWGGGLVVATSRGSSPCGTTGTEICDAGIGSNWLQAARMNANKISVSAILFFITCLIGASWRDEFP